MNTLRISLIQYFQNALLKHKSRTLLLAFLISQVIIPFQATAQGNLMLMQKRVVFEGSNRIATVQYANTGQDTARYIVSLVHNRMKEDGSMELIEEAGPGELFADEYVRYFPRNIVLGPNESQTIKIQLVNDHNLQPGEYRSHLYFRSVPNPESSYENKDKNAKGLLIKMKAVVGITIPLIIRVGENNSWVQLEDLAFKIQEGIPALEFSLMRSGNHSIYGDLKVTHISPAGKRTLVGQMKGVAVYTPGNLRRCNINLQTIDNVDFSRGSLLVSYTKQKEGKSPLLAEAEMLLK